MRYLSLLFLSSFTLANAAEPVLEKVDIFSAGDAKVALYRIPGVVVTPKGTILAYCEARRSTKADWGEIEIHMRRSTDGGKTFLPVQHIAHTGERIEGNPTKKSGGEKEQTVNNPVAIVDRKSGDIVFLYCVNYAHCFSMRSTDEGATWSKPVEITDSFAAYYSAHPWTVLATGPGHGIQLKSGRMVVPIWLAYGKNGAHKPSVAGTIFSDDLGKTWKPGDLCMPNKGKLKDPNESILTELSDGKVMIITRSPSEANRKLVSISSDGATKWTEPKFHDELWEPVCMASVISHPSKAGTLIYSNPHTLPRDKDGKEIPGGRGKRENLSIKISRDDGKTWPVNKTLEAGASAYSDLAVLPDGTVICLYENKDKLTVARFNIAWVEQK